ncbi:MAG: rhomboid family intramembrane serine protease [Elusimicrobiota bacterium]
MFGGITPFDQLTRGIKSLVIAYVAIYFSQYFLPTGFLSHLALTPIEIFRNYKVWQVFTYSFVHGSGWHLFFNVLALWMIGPHLESLWGTPKFLRFYFLCSFGAALCQFFIAPYQTVVGASGAIYGLLMAFGLLFPDIHIYLFFFFPVKALQAVLFIAVLSLVLSMGSGGSHIAHIAHLGGMLMGLLLIKAPEWRGALPTWLSKRPFGKKSPTFHVIHPDSNESLKEQVDIILEKISRQGIDSLTKKEHELMREYAKKKK